MKKYLPAIVAGFGAGVLHVVPITKALTCCLVIPLAATAAIMLEQKANKIIGEFPLKRGVILGILTGLFAALFGSFFDIFITFITKNNDLLLAFNELNNVIDSIPVPENIKQETLTLMKSVADQIRQTGFSSLYAFAILFNNLVVDLIFGAIGGLVGTKILNARNSEK